MSPRTVLILNPTSGASALATGQGTPQEHEEMILAALRTYGIEPEVQYTTPEDVGNGLAQAAAARGAEIVIAAGGDGTLHAVATGLIDTASLLGIIPMGTMNNIAHSLQIPENIEEACEIIATGASSKIDIGTLNEHVFLEVAGIGIEAALFPAAEEIKSIGVLSSVRGIIDGLKALFAFRATRYAVSFDGRRTRRFQALQISVCNSPYYGARLQFAPNAVMDDGFLDVLIYKNFSKLEYLRHAISIRQGRRVLEPKVTHRKVKTIRIRAEQSVPVHIDGVPNGETPVQISIRPGALNVRVPVKVAAGPSLTSPAEKRTPRYKQATADHRSREEKGTLNVK